MGLKFGGEFRSVGLHGNGYFCPVYLKEGDLIGIVSPSRAISEEEVLASEAFLRAEGFEPIRAAHLFERHHQFAGTDSQKVADIQAFLDNPDIKAIWSSRGGYGAARIIDQLDFSGLKKDFKWLVGYSDFTVFHAHLNRLGMPSLHATMPVNIKTDANPEDCISMDTMIAALKGEQLEYQLGDHPLNRQGAAEGELVGGNLSIIYSLCGSASGLDTKGKILFMEDLDEYLYHIDRMMVNLDRNGILSDLAGLIIGGMTDMNDNSIPYGKTAEEIILERCSVYDYPIYFGFEAGHCSPNRAMRFGMKCRIEDNRLLLFS